MPSSTVPGPQLDQSENERFVDQLYLDLLDRHAESTAVRNWSASLDNGSTRVAVAWQIEQSAEYRGRIIQNLYGRLLGRTVDATTWNQFLNMQAVDSEETLAGIVLGSDEYYQNRAGGTDPMFVTALYHDLLDRGLDMAGLGFCQALNAGLPRTAVVDAIQNTAELETRTVTGLYEKILFRVPTTNELNLCVRGMQAGMSATRIVASLVGSDEYFMRLAVTGTPIASQQAHYAVLVNKLYQDFAGRAPSNEESSQWTGRFTQAAAAGQPVTISIFEFLRAHDTAEGQPTTTDAIRDQVAGWYHDHLGRTQSLATLASLPEIDPWVRRLTAYTDPLAILAEFLSADEYLGFPADAYNEPGVEWAAAPGPFVQPVADQPSPPATFHTGDPVLTTTYFYWYDTITGNNVRYADGSDHLTHHPITLTGFSYLNVGWHKQQLQDMSAAGIDVALPVYWGSPFSDPTTNDPALIDPTLLFSDEGLRRLVQARHELVGQGESPPRIGMFYDTTTLSGLNARQYHADLRTLGGKEWFYETIRNFFSHMPAADWACVDDKPLVFLYHLGYAAGLDSGLISFIQEHFQRDFGVTCFIVACDEQRAPPDPGGGYAELLRQHNSLDVLRTFLASDDFFASCGGDNGVLVDRLYDRLLAREPSPAERSMWVNALANMPRSVVIASLVYSDEALHTLVAGWYRHFLRRLESLAQIKQSPEIAPLVHGLAAGEEPLAVLASLLAGDVFYQASGSSDAGLVSDLYQQVLVRGPDGPGLAGWLRRLHAETREKMIGEFLTSDESREVLVASWTYYYEGRLWPGPVDAEYTWGGAGYPQFRDVADLGPGFDNAALRTPSRLNVARNDGSWYQAAWNTLLAMNPHPWLVQLETWNELQEGTDLCETREFGRQYIDLTRHFADLFHASRQL